MKEIRKKTVIALILLLTLTVTQAKTNEGNSYQEKSKIYMKIWVDGLACPFCAYGLEKQIKKAIKAKEFKVAINEGFITISVPSDKKPTEEELSEIIKEAGFKLRKIEYSKEPFEMKKDEKE